MADFVAVPARCLHVLPDSLSSETAVRLQRSFSHSFSVWEKVIALLAFGKLDPSPLIGRAEPLANWRQYLEEMVSGKIVKGLLKPGDLGAS